MKLFFCFLIICPLFTFGEEKSPLDSYKKFRSEIEGAAFQMLDKDATYFPGLLFALKKFPFDRYFITKDVGQGSFLHDIRGETYQGDVIKGILEIGGIWEQFMVDHIKQYVKPGSIAIDIGAHIGTHTVSMARSVGPEGLVYAFEPQPKIFRELFMNLIINQQRNVKLYPIAIGEEDSYIELRPLVPLNEAGTPLGGQSTTCQFVPMKPLDSFHLTNVSLIKIDVEGMEPQFLRGAKQTILNSKPIILIELGGGECYETTSQEVRQRIDDSIATLESYGYKVARAKGAWAACWDYLAVPL